MPKTLNTLAETAKRTGDWGAFWYEQRRQERLEVVERAHARLSGLYWISNTSMTVGVALDGGMITDAPPIVKRFVGQRAGRLIAWMNTDRGVRWTLCR